MVEEVEDFSSELSVGPLTDVKALRYGDIGVEVPWPIRRVAAAEVFRSWTGESSSRSAVCCKRCHGREELAERPACRRLQTANAGTCASRVSGPAWPRIDI